MGLNILDQIVNSHTLSLSIIIVLVIMVANFAGLFGYWVYSFNKTGSSKYSFTSNLPFELNRYRRDSKSGVRDLSWIVLSLILLVLPIITFAILHNLASGYALLLIYLLEAGTFGFLLFTKLSNYRGHITTVAIFVGLQIAVCIYQFLVFTSIKAAYISNDIVCYIVMAFIILQLIFQFVLILNPTYKGWARMQKMDCGTFSRPKYCYIAMLEWGTFLNMLLNYVVILLISFF